MAKFEIDKDSVTYKVGYKDALKDVINIIKQNSNVEIGKIKSLRNSIKL